MVIVRGYRRLPTQIRLVLDRLHTEHREYNSSLLLPENYSIYSHQGPCILLSHSLTLLTSNLTKLRKK